MITAHWECTAEVCNQINLPLLSTGTCSLMALPSGRKFISTGRSTQPRGLGQGRMERTQILNAFYKVAFYKVSLNQARNINCWLSPTSQGLLHCERENGEWGRGWGWLSSGSLPHADTRSGATCSLLTCPLGP